MATKTKTTNRIAEVNGDGHPPETKRETLTITPPNIQVMQFKLIGTAPYVQNRFSHKAMEQMKAKQQAGSTSKKGTKRDAKDFEECYKQAMHVSKDGWHGIPASAFRNAMISACRLVGFRMTLGKLSLFTKADGYDVVDGTPLVRITKGEPRYVEHAVRNDSGVADIRPRPMWEPGWEAVVEVSFDADQFSKLDMVNLMHRVGVQIGIGEGRNDSKNSAGMGWGSFRLADEGE